jgi:phosphohistidine phosphatase
MKLYLVRHAEAISRTAEVPDAQRYLTPKGRLLFRKTARRLIRYGALPAFICTSPLVRAVQTAEILAGEIGFLGPLVVMDMMDMLGPGFGRAELRSVISKCAGAEEIALVGHEPDLGDLVSSLLSLSEPRPLKKGEVVALEPPSERRGLSGVLPLVRQGREVRCKEGI